MCVVPGSAVDVHAERQAHAQPWWTYSASTESQKMCAAEPFSIGKARCAGSGEVLSECMLSAQPEHSLKTEPIPVLSNTRLDEVGGSMQPI